jgi:hypothetical protein
MMAAKLSARPEDAMTATVARSDPDADLGEALRVAALEA